MFFYIYIISNLKKNCNLIFPDTFRLDGGVGIY